MTPNDQAMKSITPYPEIDQLLSFFTSRIASILRTNLKGIYLTGSLSYNDFNYNSSDIDIMVMLNRPISTEELKVIAQFHQQLEQKFKFWSKRLECTYTPIDMLSRIKPPSQPRPWYWIEGFVLSGYFNDKLVNKWQDEEQSFKTGVIGLDVWEAEATFDDIVIKVAPSVRGQNIATLGQQ